MKFSLGKTVVTPDFPVFQRGFGARTHQSVGVHDELYAKALLLSADKTLLMLTLDMAGSDRSFIVGIKNALQETFGFAHDEVMINFSHTHASVAVTGEDVSLRRGGYSIAQTETKENEDELDYTKDEEYYRFVRDAIIRMVEDCRERLTEGTLEVACGRSRFAVSRRRPSGGTVTWQPYYEGEIDRDLFVLKLTDPAGTVRGILYNVACHPTTMGADNYLISAEFPGKTSAVLEEAYPGAVAMFLQGCAAELKPMKTADGDRFRACTMEEMEEAGEELAREVLDVLAHGTFTQANGPFRSALVEARLETEPYTKEHYEKMVESDRYTDFYKKTIRRMIRAFDEGRVLDSIPLYVHAWILGDNTRIIAVEGEVSTEYSLKIKKMFAGRGQTITLGYTNGVFCYIPTRKILREGGYEAENNYFYRLRGPFVPEIEDEILARVAEVGGLHEIR